MSHKSHRTTPLPTVAVVAIAAAITIMLFVLTDRGFGTEVQVQGLVTAQTTSGKSFHSVGTIEGGTRIHSLPIANGDLVPGQRYQTTCTIGRLSLLVLTCEPYTRVYGQEDQWTTTP